MIRVRIALRAGAARKWFKGKMSECFWRYIHKPGGKVQQLDYFRLCQAVIDMPPVAPGGYQASLTQRHQVLRDSRLAHAKDGFNMADAGFIFPNDEKCLHAGRLLNLR